MQLHLKVIKQMNSITELNTVGADHFHIFMLPNIKQIAPST